MNDTLKKQIELLPDCPGSYQMRNKDDQIIYIGKAKNLKKRVSQYFLRPQNGKTAAMVFNVDHFTIITTKTEKEALILEMNLIQKYHPRYNIMLMDDSHYPYIAIYKDVANPYVTIARNTKNKKAEYFGPYPNSSAAYNVLDIINRLFPLRKCKNVPKAPCLYYHMHECLAPCINKIEKEQYDEIIANIRNFLKGKNQDIIKELKQKIEDSSNNLQFEQALDYKKMLDSINAISEKQVMEFKDNINRDFIAFATRDGYIGIVILIMREGMIIFKKSFIYELIDDIDDILSDVIMQYYQQNAVPKEIVVANEAVKKDIESLFEVNVISPQKGKLFEVLKITQQNAKEALDEHFMTARLEDNNLQILEELGKILHIKTPLRIELFDNSHLMGTNAIGAMVCFINGEPYRNMYRKFNINSENKMDDLSSMKEVIFRRYSRLKKENQDYPDLICVDGGFEQLEAAKLVLEKIDVDIPLCGLVKSSKHETAGLVDINNNVYDLANNKPLFFLLTRMQDEVHRFAISTHIKKRNKVVFKSIFDDVEGIGDARKETLLKAYPTIDDLKKASLQELNELLPLSVATNLYNKIKEIN